MVRPSVKLEPYKEEIWKRIFEQNQKSGEIIAWLHSQGQPCCPRTYLRTTTKWGFRRRTKLKKSEITPEFVTAVRREFVNTNKNDLAIAEDMIARGFPTSRNQIQRIRLDNGYIRRCNNKEQLAQQRRETVGRVAELVSELMQENIPHQGNIRDFVTKTLRERYNFNAREKDVRTALKIMRGGKTMRTPIRKELAGDRYEDLRVLKRKAREEGRDLQLVVPSTPNLDPALTNPYTNLQPSDYSADQALQVNHPVNGYIPHSELESPPDQPMPDMENELEQLLDLPARPPSPNAQVRQDLALDTTAYHPTAGIYAPYLPKARPATQGRRALLGVRSIPPLQRDPTPEPTARPKRKTPVIRKKPRTPYNTKKRRALAEAEAARIVLPVKPKWFYNTKKRRAAAAAAEAAAASAEQMASEASTPATPEVPTAIDASVFQSSCSQQWRRRPRGPYNTQKKRAQQEAATAAPATPDETSSEAPTIPATPTFQTGADGSVSRFPAFDVSTTRSTPDTRKHWIAAAQDTLRMLQSRNVNDVPADTVRDALAAGIVLVEKQDAEWNTLAKDYTSAWRR